MVHHQEEVVAANGLDHDFIVDPNTQFQDNVTGPRSGKDADAPIFGVGQKVKLTKEIVNDGTYPHSPIGTLMMPKDSIGYIKDL